MKRFVAVLLVCAHAALASSSSAHWRDLGPLIADRDVVVALNDGKSVKGRTESVNADSVVIATRRGRVSVSRQSVHEVRVARQATHKWRVIGLLVGAGVGAAIAAPILAETHNEGSGRYDAAAVGLVGGLAALGFFGGWRADHSSDVIDVLPD
jgi:hypothetical protein